MSEPVIIPEQDIAIGDNTIYEGINLIAQEHFSQGKDAKQSGLKYFMYTPKGVIGFKEV